MIANDTLIQTLDLIEQRTGLEIDPRRDAHRRQDLIACLETLTAEYAQHDPRELLRLLRDVLKRDDVEAVPKGIVLVAKASASHRAIPPKPLGQ